MEELTLPPPKVIEPIGTMLQMVTNNTIAQKVLYEFLISFWHHVDCYKKEDFFEKLSKVTKFEQFENIFDNHCKTSYYQDFVKLNRTAIFYEERCRVPYDEKRFFQIYSTMDYRCTKCKEQRIITQGWGNQCQQCTLKEFAKSNK